MTSCFSTRLLHPVLLGAALLVSGCASINSGEGPLRFFQPYRVEVVQGNVVTQEMIERVKPGMTRLQVRDALGAPLLTDPFHTERWDYVFTIRARGTPFQQRRVTAIFGKDDRLISIEADALPTERDFVASIDRGNRGSGALPVLELSPEQIRALPVPTKPATPAPSAAAAVGRADSGPARSYPPLEPAK